MSYDLHFWRQRLGAEIDPERLLDELQDTVQFSGIVGIPLDTVELAFRKEFPEVTGGAGSLDWEGDGSYFQVASTFLDERTASKITVSCGYELLKSQQAVKRLKRVAASLDCRIYDPQRHDFELKTEWPNAH